MKKLVLMLAVVFSMSFFACGNKEQAAEATDAAADSAAVVEVVEEACTGCACDSCTCDSCACDTVVAVAEEAVVAE